MIKDEQICQINTMNWLRQLYPHIEEGTYHFANERKCTIQQGRLLKRMGVKRGVSDIFIAIPKHGKSGLWLEIKVGSNYPSKEQKEFLQRQLKNNYAAACCWEFESVQRVIVYYLSDSSSKSIFDQVIYEKAA